MEQCLLKLTEGRHSNTSHLSASRNGPRPGYPMARWKSVIMPQDAGNLRSNMAIYKVAPNVKGQPNSQNYIVTAASSLLQVTCMKIWTIILLLCCGLFTVMSIMVIIGGAFDVRKLLRRLREQENNGDPDPTH